MPPRPRPCTLAAIALLPLLLVACSQANRFETGEAIDREALTSVADSVPTTAPETEPTTEPTPETEVLYPAGTVFWLDRDTTYHYDPNCRHLFGGERIRHGPVGNAWIYGKRIPCDECRPDASTDTEQPSPEP